MIAPLPINTYDPITAADITQSSSMCTKSPIVSEKNAIDLNCTFVFQFLQHKIYIFLDSRFKSTRKIYS